MNRGRKKVYRRQKKRQKLEKLAEDIGTLSSDKNSPDLDSDNSISEHNLNVNVLDISDLSSDKSNNSDSDKSNNLNNSVVSNSDSEFLVSSNSEDEFLCEEADVTEIKELQEWAISNNVPHTQVDSLLKILRRRLLPSLPNSAKTFLKCNVDLSHLEKMQASDGSEGEFIYLGIGNQLVNKIDTKFHDSGILELIFNIDGMSPFKSSSVAVWPILCKVFTNSDVYEPFTVAVYSGNGKPKCCSKYLNKFIVEINELIQNGIVVEKKVFKVKIKFFNCDSPARAFLKCIVSHVGFNGCERCTVKGQKINGVTVFLQTDAERRSDETFRAFVHPNHHTGVSPLYAIEPPINLVSEFVLDPMHLLYLGCTNRILEYLLSSSGYDIRLSATLKAELIRRTALIHKDIPDEFPRKLRSTKHYSKYKAVEFKFFLLYAAPVVLKKLLPSKVYNHLMHFTVACRLLSDKNNLNIDQARQYFMNFVKDASALYGPTFLSLNVHNLIHVCDDVQALKCSLNELSAFPFESYLGSVSSVLRSPTHITAQYCRRLQEKEKFLRKTISIPPNLEILVEKKNEIQKIKYKGFILSLKHPNNSVILNDGTIGQISKFYKKDNTVINAEIKKYKKKESLFQCPCDSGSLSIWEVSKLADNVTQIRIDSIDKKLVKLSINFSSNETEKSFVVPLLH